MLAMQSRPRRFFPPAEPATLPLTPSAYMRLRREANGMTRDDVAVTLCRVMVRRKAGDRRPSAIFGRQAEARALVDQLETPGVKARHRDTVEVLALIVGFDPAVYWQLADEPADRHPHVCLTCGCSAHDPCRGDLGVCSLEHDACTRCDGALASRKAA